MMAVRKKVNMNDRDAVRDQENQEYASSAEFAANAPKDFLAGVKW